MGTKLETVDTAKDLSTKRLACSLLYLDSLWILFYGDLEAPQSNTWETIVRLVQNAFFKVILLGFEKELSRGGAKSD